MRRGGKLIFLVCWCKVSVPPSNRRISSRKKALKLRSHRSWEVTISFFLFCSLVRLWIFRAFGISSTLFFFWHSFKTFLNLSKVLVFLDFLRWVLDSMVHFLWVFCYRLLSQAVPKLQRSRFCFFTVVLFSTEVTTLVSNRTSQTHRILKRVCLI